MKQYLICAKAAISCVVIGLLAILIPELVAAQSTIEFVAGSILAVLFPIIIILLTKWISL